MEGEYSKLIAALFQRARQDSKYKKMGEEYGRLEEQYSCMVMQLPRESQDLAWAFICISDEMNWRMLEIICEDMKLWRSDL